MSAETRDRGWRGFDGIGERVDKGWCYTCDGMPTMLGCGRSIVVQRPWTTVGKKKDGWLVCYGLTGPDDMPIVEYTEKDLDVVLTFCPKCVIQGNVEV